MRKGLALGLVFLVVIGFFLKGTSVYAKGCWSLEERKDFEFAELEGKMWFSFKDAVSCEPIEGATVTFGSRQFQTDAWGRISLPVRVFEKLEDAVIPLKVEKEGYITLKTQVRVMAGTVWDKFFLLTKKLPLNSARFVLSWGEKPRDLDLHLVGSGFHISYRNMRSYANQAELDRDDTNGYGPETITLQRIEANKRYVLYVHNYSNDAQINQKARVYIYLNNRLDRVIDLPRTNKRVIKVLEINDKDVSYINQPCDEIK